MLDVEPGEEVVMRIRDSVNIFGSEIRFLSVRSNNDVVIRLDGKIHLLAEGEHMIKGIQIIISDVVYATSRNQRSATFVFNKEGVSAKPAGENCFDIDQTKDIAGKSITLINVASNPTQPAPVIVNVNGVFETVSGTETVNGLEVTVTETFYSDNINNRWACFDFPSVTTTLKTNVAIDFNGRSITLLNVGNADPTPVIVTVDGVSDTVTGTETVNGLEIGVVDSWYTPFQECRYAELSITQP